MAPILILAALGLIFTEAAALTAVYRWPLTDTSQRIAAQ